MLGASWYIQYIYIYIMIYTIYILWHCNCLQDLFTALLNTTLKVEWNLQFHHVWD